MSGTELKKRAFEVSEQDEPSAKWGWHGTFPRAGKIAGVFVVISMFSMLIGNQVGHVEDIYLVLFGLAFLAALVYKQARARTSWRR